MTQGSGIATGRSLGVCDTKTNSFHFRKVSITSILVEIETPRKSNAMKVELEFSSAGAPIYFSIRNTYEDQKRRLLANVYL